MNAEPELILEWHDLKEAAAEICRESFCEVKLDWLERGWASLGEAGLANCSTTLDLCKSQINFLAMITLFAEAASIVFEFQDRLVPHWRHAAETMGFDRLCLGHLVQDPDLISLPMMRDDSLYIASDEVLEQPDDRQRVALGHVLDHLVREARPGVYKALLATLGRGSESLLFGYLFISVKYVSDILAEHREWLELDDNLAASEIEKMNTPELAIRQAISDSLAFEIYEPCDTMPLFEWVRQGCLIDYW